MSDQVGAWQMLSMDTRLIVEATLRATASVLATYPYRFATQDGMCNIARRMAKKLARSICPA
eukprot:14630374-Alexandrium_andersonii.AAC.1